MSSTVAIHSLTRELAAICGPAYVSEDTATLQALAIDEVIPTCAVSPATAEEIAAVLRVASQHDCVVVPAGGCTAQTAGNVLDRIDVLLDTRRLTELEHYDPGDLTIGIGAGCNLAALDARLASNGQFLPVDLAAPEQATLGGLLATAAHGPLRHGYGSLRDFCIGMQFVTGDGKIARGGGRVVKNVAGYDLMKLLIGSHGTLGVITGINFKVFPRLNKNPSHQTHTYVMEFTNSAAALTQRDAILRSPLTPACLELVSPRAQEYLRPRSVTPRNPDEYIPPHPLPREEDRAWQLVIRAVGSNAVLTRYRTELGSVVTRELAGDEESAFWRTHGNFQQAVAERHQNAMIAQIGVPITGVQAAITAASQAGIDNNLLTAFIGRAGLGALVVAFIPLSVDPPSAMQYASAISALRAELPELGTSAASVIVTRCPTEAKRHFDVWGSTPTDLDCMRAVKHALDPKGILNRGRFLP